MKNARLETVYEFLYTPIDNGEFGGLLEPQCQGCYLDKEYVEYLVEKNNAGKQGYDCRFSMKEITCVYDDSKNTYTPISDKSLKIDALDKKIVFEIFQRKNREKNLRIGENLFNQMSEEERLAIKEYLKQQQY